MIADNTHRSLRLPSHVDIDGFSHFPVAENTNPTYEVRFPRLLVTVDVGKYENVLDADISVKDAALLQCLLVSCSDSYQSMASTS